VISRSGTLTYDVVSQLTSLGIGQSTCVGIGGDVLPGSTFVNILELFEEDQDTNAVVLIGEIGGTMEQEAARFINDKMSKPVVVFIAGSTAPPGKRMGHAGAIITGNAGKASEKIKALSQAGATIAPNPAEVGLTIKKVLETL
jgi:succinyl-CoA synthetase alpha subunit